MVLVKHIQVCTCFVKIQMLGRNSLDVSLQIEISGLGFAIATRVVFITEKNT